MFILQAVQMFCVYYFDTLEEYSVAVIALKLSAF